MDFLYAGPSKSELTILLAHGAGAPMDSDAMNAIALALGGRGLRTARFEFDYMAQRRVGGRRRPPPRAERLTDEYLHAIERLGARQPLFIGGKSMGGRVASMLADQLYRKGQIAGLICLGYPFHPPAKPDHLRTAHLEGIATPTLICQGTRDPFGNRTEVEGYKLSKAITIDWIEDGDHDFKATRASGRSTAENIEAMADRVVDCVRSIANTHQP